MSCAIEAAVRLDLDFVPFRCSGEARRTQNPKPALPIIAFDRRSLRGRLDLKRAAFNRRRSTADKVRKANLQRLRQAPDYGKGGIGLPPSR